MDKNTQGRIRALHCSYKTVSEIAEETGLDSSIVAYELDAMGYRPRYEKEKPEPSEFLAKKAKTAEKETKQKHHRATADERDRIINLRKEGKTKQQIANLSGLSYSTVDSVLRSHRAKEKEPAPAATDTSPKAENLSKDYHTAFSEFCQEGDRLISRLETWLDEFISEVYNYQSEEWQHGYDTGEKLSELRSLIRKAKGEQV